MNGKKAWLMFDEFRIWAIAMLKVASLKRNSSFFPSACNAITVRAEHLGSLPVVHQELKFLNTQLRTEFNRNRRKSELHRRRVLAACKCSPTAQGESEDVKQTNRPYLDVPARSLALKQEPSRLAPGFPADRGCFIAPEFNESLNTPVIYSFSPTD